MQRYPFSTVQQQHKGQVGVGGVPAQKAVVFKGIGIDDDVVEIQVHKANFPL